MVRRKWQHINVQGVGGGGGGGGLGPSISFPSNISEMDSFSNIIINSQFMNDAWSLRSLKIRTVQLLLQ